MHCDRMEAVVRALTHPHVVNICSWSFYRMWCFRYACFQPHSATGLSAFASSLSRCKACRCLYYLLGSSLSSAMSVKRCRIVNKSFRRRVPEVFGHGSDDVISTFHEAAWLAGPVGVLRARVTQRGLSVIFDVPRAGALVKHHLTQHNDPQRMWRLLEGVCGLCLARYDDDLWACERCLWCGDTTLCRACHLPVHISRDDGRVQECFDPAIWGNTYANIKMKRPYPEAPDGSGRVIIPGCVSCVREWS